MSLTLNTMMMQMQMMQGYMSGGFCIERMC